jgi:transcriptional regulator with XRE-family HTH domain
MPASDSVPGLTDDETPLGEYIRRQRELQAMSMRQLANMVGISNPYLSQIERGLREPSERVLDAIARNLELSADAVQEHVRSRRPASQESSAVVEAIKQDPALTPRQRQALIAVYRELAG